MARALELAVLAKRICKPNPAVGAVLVRADTVVGEGFTQPAGHAHAEIMALEQAGERACGATLYVTLEPCSHHGRTAPCVDALISAGVRDVHASMIDPSPWVNGRGVDLLRLSGVCVELGEEAALAHQLNEGYFTWIECGRPFVTGVFSGSLEQVRGLMCGHDVPVVATDSMESLCDDADRVVVDRSELIVDVPSWTRAFKSLAGQDVQHVILDANETTLEILMQQGLVDRIALVPSEGLVKPPVAQLHRGRLVAMTLNGLVACSAGL
ncbi:MAG: bifunctional diaminohydroxyphosphoribosylaminopyrimidine deaminase/5-amino-6-(5-phosphoribosylamino)uracil reductase RibD [Chloroflexota bacterium]